MSKLKAVLTQQIRDNGPLTIADYMNTCLLHPRHGYYSTRDPLGAQGDFTTAPEISQMFGELLGLSIAQAWLDQGSPHGIRLVELGPGRGTLTADLLRATTGIPGFHNALTLHLVEVSPTLRTTQNQTINHPLTHHEGIDGIPEGPFYLIANEFFDALPVRQFQREKNGWRERVVGLGADGLTFGLSDPMRLAALADRMNDTRDGDIVEHAPAAQAVASTIGQRINAHGGVAVIIDYGGWRSLGDTFQALRAHGMVDPLQAPGTADLTAHVDFEALARAAEPAEASAMVGQGVLLERLGITARARKLGAELSGDTLASHIAAHRRLTHPQEMGTLFKAMALYQKDTLVPAGFAP